MNHLHNFAISLLAQDGVDPANESTGPIGWLLELLANPIFQALLTIALTVVACFVVGAYYTRSVRLSEMGWKVGLMLSCLFVSA